MKKDQTFMIIKERVNQVGNILNLSDKEINLLLSPKRIAKGNLVVEGEKIPAWRILYNNALGPGKGGIRFHPEASKDEVESLAFWMTLKNSLVGLPYGGAKGGVRFNPKGKSKEYLEKVSRAYIDKFYPFLGENIDIPAPDVYTNPQVMAWMLDEYEKKVGHHAPAMITGKPIELGGLQLRADSTAKGGKIILEEVIHHDGIGKNPTIAIQGFGNAGYNIARMLDSDEFKIIAVSDSKGGIYDKNGLDIKRVSEIKIKTGTVTSYKAKNISNNDLLELPVDILILAALENQITKENAGRVKAKYIIELANGPVDFEGDKILDERGIIVVPDILANAGGVIVSYFEWAQNKTGNIMDHDYLSQKLFLTLESAWHQVYELYKDNEGIDLRTAAYIIAIKRVLEAERSRGNLK